MSIYIASDHRGVALKEYLVQELSKESNVIKSKIENSSEDDYPDFAFDVCMHMSKERDLGILICGNGIGIAIAANKVNGIRCGRVTSIDDAKASKEHNHANVISLPASMDHSLALEICKAFINSVPSDEDRHVRRVNKITLYENGEYNAI
ncbi:MAG: RpiB/LacA/LacB family sugar-phosphate isomerase [Bacilli bacterium]|nr:RpiB/LacA/LacB family sugar-phosphate isomerase [Bacilli bacterium]